MKNILRLFAVVAVLLCSVMVSSVEAKSKKEIVTLEIPTDVDCPSCEAKIMNTIPFQKGIKRVAVDLKSGVVTVSYDASKSDEETIKESLRKIKVNILTNKPTSEY